MSGNVPNARTCDRCCLPAAVLMTPPTKLDARTFQLVCKDCYSDLESQRYDTADRAYDSWRDEQVLKGASCTAS